MVPGDERDMGVFAVLAQQLLDQRVVLVVPEPSRRAATINEVAHEVEVGGFGVAENSSSLPTRACFVPRWTSDIQIAR